MANLGMHLNGTGALDLEGWLVAAESKVTRGGEPLIEGRHSEQDCSEAL
jgi:hypothetical protein